MEYKRTLDGHGGGSGQRKLAMASNLNTLLACRLGE
jgi:hypothetical protein